MSTACREGDLGNWGRSGADGGSTSDIIYKDDGQPGSRRGPYDRLGRVMPAEGRALAPGVLVKEETER